MLLQFLFKFEILIETFRSLSAAIWRETISILFMSRHLLASLSWKICKLAI